MEDRKNPTKSSGKSKESEDLQTLKQQLVQLQYENTMLQSANEQNFRVMLLQELQAIRAAIAQVVTAVEELSLEEEEDKRDDEDDVDEEED